MSIGLAFVCLESFCDNLLTTIGICKYSTLLKLKNISFEKEYSIPKEDQEMVDLLCTLYNVKNINEKKENISENTNTNDAKLSFEYNTFKTFLTNFKNKFTVYKYVDYSTFVTDIDEFMNKNLIKKI